MGTPGRPDDAPSTGKKTIKSWPQMVAEGLEVYPEALLNLGSSERDYLAFVIEHGVEPTVDELLLDDSKIETEEDLGRDEDELAEELLSPRQRLDCIALAVRQSLGLPKNAAVLDVRDAALARDAAPPEEESEPDIDESELNYDDLDEPELLSAGELADLMNEYNLDEY